MRKGDAMRIAVCDRKAEDREFLKKQISEYWRGVPVDVFDSGEEIFTRIREGIWYDMVFLNVEDDDTQNLKIGAALERRFPNIALVLESASRSFGAEAFEMEALYYIVKPYSPEDFRKIRSRFLELQERRETIPIDKMIPLGKENLREIPYRQITYLESCHNYLLVHLTSGAVTKIRGSLQEVMDYGDDYFLRVNRHYIVNMEAIVGIQGNICEAAGRVFVFSRQNKTANKKKYSEWLFRRAIGDLHHD